MIMYVRDLQCTQTDYTEMPVPTHADWLTVDRWLCNHTQACRLHKDNYLNTHRLTDYTQMAVQTQADTLHIENIHIDWLTDCKDQANTPKLTDYPQIRLLAHIVSCCTLMALQTHADFQTARGGSTGTHRLVDYSQMPMKMHTDWLYTDECANTHRLTSSTQMRVYKHTNTLHTDQHGNTQEVTEGTQMDRQTYTEGQTTHRCLCKHTDLQIT